MDQLGQILVGGDNVDLACFCKLTRGSADEIVGFVSWGFDEWNVECFKELEDAIKLHDEIFGR